MPANTFLIVCGVQNPCYCQYRALFIKKVKLLKQPLSRKVKIFENTYDRVHIQNAAGLKN